MFLLRRPSRPQSSAGGKVTLQEANVKVIRLEGGRPWGFKIAGGAEVNKPILITKINPAGQAANFAINEGDMITR
ncbi:unnamed protein product [Oikopleura dioica]|uniref:PDZ domain-containing protein n=1 Tax=Oikopleura dioica TaxID=34765 RepID=E4X6V0_OIKDI|nr:unnamed protein product [Oikopleura dioica]